MSGRLGGFLVGAALFGAAFIPGVNVTLFGVLSVKGMLLTAGLGLAANALVNPNVTTRQDGIERNTASPQSAIPVVYGRTKVGLRVVDMRVDPTNRDILYIVGAVSHGPIEAIDEIYFDDRLAFNADGSLVTPGPGTRKVAGLDTPAAWVTKYLGTDDQTVDPDLTDVFPTSWPSTSRGRGIAYVVVKLWYSEEGYPTGIPNITCIVRGRTVYDPRDGSTAYSTNPALCWRDYMTHERYGAACDATEIDDDSVTEMANYYDDTLLVPDDDESPWSGISNFLVQRFSTNGWVDTARPIEENVRDLLTSCRGQMVYQGGTFRIFTRKPALPVSFELTEDTIIGQWSFYTPGIRDKKNVGRATFIDPRQRYQPNTTQWPEPDETNSYLTADNEFESVLEVDLPFTSNYYTAQQIVMVAVKESRNCIACEVTAKESALQLQVGDIVNVTHPTPGWKTKQFWVVGLVLLPNATVRLGLLEYDPLAYNLNAQTQRVSPPDSELPNPFECAAPTNLRLTNITGVTYVPRVFAEWDAADEPFLHHYELQVKRSSEGESGWDDHGPASRNATSYILTPVPGGVSVDVRVRAVNTLGVPSDWVEATILTVAEPQEEDTVTPILEVRQTASTATTVTFSVEARNPKPGGIEPTITFEMVNTEADGWVGLGPHILYVGTETPNEMVGAITGSATVSGTLGNGTGVGMAGAASGAGTVAGSLTVTSVGLFDHWNEPAGFTTLVENSLGTLPPIAMSPAPQHGEAGYAEINLDGSHNFSLLQNAGGPAPGSAHALRLKYPVGFTNGRAPGTINYKSHENSNDFLEWDELYVQYTIRVTGNGSGTYENQTVGTKIGFFGHGRDPVRRGSNQLYLMLNNSSGDMEDTSQINRVDFFQQNVATRREAPADSGNVAMPIDVGVWYTFEVLMQLDSAPDAGDGVFKMWITNHETGERRLQHDLSDVVYRVTRLDANDGVPMTHRLHPVMSASWTWGGGGNDVKTRDDYIDTDYVYISGTGGS